MANRLLLKRWGGSDEVVEWCRGRATRCILPVDPAQIAHKWGM